MLTRCCARQVEADKCVDAEKNRIDMDVSVEEIDARLKEWKAPSMPVTRGVLAKYARLVGDASHGAMTDLF